ncbi:hypothetical protein HDU76_008025 [Blyttiomyces sp. JEL0837]|nr:hypothetical protein HDU76_008025 [Blyttiomyces sp. JEL0837]
MDDMKGFDINAMSDEDVFTCIMAIGFNGDLEVLKFLEGRRKNWNRVLDHVLTLVVKSMESGHVHILRYIEPVLDDVVTVDLIGRQIFHTKHLDCWAWYVDFCRKHNLTIDAVPLIKNLTQAQHIVAKLGPNTLTYDVINYAALNANVEVFDCLWSYRSDHFWSYNYFSWMSSEDIAKASVNSKSAMLFLLEFHDFYNSEHITVSLEAVRFLYTHKPESSQLESIFEAAIWDGNVEVVEFLHQHGVGLLEDGLLETALQCKQIRLAEMLYENGCRIPTPHGFDFDGAATTNDINVVEFLQKHFPTARCSPDAMNLSARWSHLEMVKLFNENRSEVCVETAMVAAAKNADYDMVVYLFENERGDCNLKKVLVEAIKSQSMRLVRFLIANGVHVVNQDIRDQISKDLLGSVNDEMAELVRTHLFPTGLIDIIFSKHADILTRYLNITLSNEEIENRASDIWNEAFDENWTGDLTLLPKDGLPTALTGLCTVESRSMYDRHCKLRPDLTGISDDLKVFLHNDYWYGRYARYPYYRPIILLDDDEVPKPTDKSNSAYHVGDIFDSVISKRIAPSLIQIAMRHCWIDEFELAV